MKRLSVIAGVLGAVVVAALVVAPAAIDWDGYRGSIAAELSRATGRTVVLDGPIEASFLPSPRILANNVRLSGPAAEPAAGAGDGDLLRLRAVELQVGLLPLLTGHVVVERLTLVRPEILVESDADGGVRWVMDGAGGDLLPEVALQRFAISDGTLVWRDRDRGVRARVEKIALKLTAESLSGPAKATGSATVGGVPVRFTVSVGHVAEAAPTALNISFDAGELRSKAEFIGQWSPAERRLTGRIKANGADARAALAALGGTDAAQGIGPALIAHPFAVEGRLAAEGASLEANDVIFDLADQRATGTLRARFADGARPLAIDASFSAPKVDLGSLATVPPLPVRGSAPAGLPDDVDVRLGP